MNERDELAALRREQARLEKELGFISLRLTRLERHVSSVPEPGAEAASEASGSLSTAAIRAAPGAMPQAATPAPKAIPPVIGPSAAGTFLSSPAQQNQPTAAPPQTVSPAAATAATPAPGARSLELQLGTYWAPRVGIVVLLTGLVFLGNLAYQRLGALGKVLLLYCASGILLGAGAWWQRNGKEALRNYAQVLFAGGLAALYFTTYAAHHLESLRVIHNVVLDGVLLLGCAAVMVWTANRWRSEILGMFGIGLAYYSCVMTRAGNFTLYSNLLLTIAAVFFLVRNRWLAVSFGSVVATYAAYGFWRFFGGTHWHWASPEEGLWWGTSFLAGYWIVFTAGVFLSRDPKFAGSNRAAFLTLNNGAFFTMFLLTMLQVNTGGFWKFCLIYGSVLLALAEGANRTFSEEDAPKNFYLTQGLLLCTVGFISRFAGLHLALILAAESVLLLMLAYQRKNVVLFAGCLIAGALSIGWGMDGMRQQDPAGIYLGVGLGALMLTNAVLADYFIRSAVLRLTGEQKTAWTSVSGAAPAKVPGGLRPQVGYFVILALAVWFVVTWNNVAREVFPLVLAMEGVALTLSVYLLRVREIVVFSQSNMLLAVFGWWVRWNDSSVLPPWWNPLLLILLVLILSHWWQTQQALAVSAPLRQAWQFTYGLGIVTVLYFWLSKTVSPPQWLALSSALAVGLTACAVVTRAWFLGICSQLFVVVATLQFAAQVATAQPNGWFALAPIGAIAVLSGATVQWFASRPDAPARARQPLLQTAQIYRWITVPMALAWVFEYVPAQGRMMTLTGVGLAVFLFAGWKQSREALVFGAVFSGSALVYFWTTAGNLETIYWANLVAVLIVLLQQQVARKMPERFPLDLNTHGGVIFAGGLTVWWFATRWVLEQSSGFFLTASWSLLALIYFGCGIVLRERVYRWLGLGLIALALARIVIVDVWRLEMLYRILSFMALGIVLLVLGFVYSKYQEKIRQWL